MPQVIIHIPDPAQITDAVKARATGPDSNPMFRPLFASWFQYLPVAGNITKVRRAIVQTETAAEELGIDMQADVTGTLEPWLAEQGYIPNRWRDTEHGFCTTRVTRACFAAETTAPDRTDPNRCPFRFVARDMQGQVYAEGFASAAGLQNALDAFAAKGQGATHLDVYHRGDDKIADTRRWAPAAPNARGRG